MRRKELASVAVDRHSSFPAVILRVGERAHQHASWQRIERMRADKACLFVKIDDRIDKFRLRRICAHVEHENLIVVEAPRPNIFTVVGEAHVMRFSTAADRNIIDDLSISLGRWIDVDGDELVALVAHTFYAERPYLEKLFLPLDQRGCVGRKAGLVGYCVQGQWQRRQWYD